MRGSVGPDVLQPHAIRATDIDAVEGAGHAVEAGGVDQDVEFVFLLARLDAVRRDALDRLVILDVDQQDVVAVVGLEIAALQRHAPGAEAVVLRDQLVRDLRVLHALADLLGDELADRGVGLLVGQDVAEIAHPDAEARLRIKLFPERLALLRRHVQRLAGIGLVDEPARRLAAVGVDLLVAGLDLLHLRLADLGIVQRRRPVRPALEDGELLAPAWRFPGSPGWRWRRCR